MTKKAVERTHSVDRSVSRRVTRTRNVTKQDEPISVDQFQGDTPITEKSPAEAGDLNQETLDSDAPYNKTYGHLPEEMRKKAR